MSDGPGVYHRSVKGGAWYMASVFFQKAFGVLTFFVLARLLVPADYGVISVVLLVTGLAAQFTAVSFGDALTQRQEDIEPYLDPLWTLELGRALLLAAGIAVASPWLGAFFHLDAAAMPLLRWSGLLLVLPALSNVRQIHLFKELDLRRIFFRDAAGQIAFSAAALGLAFFVRKDAGALFGGYLAQYLVVIAASYAIYPARPALSFAIGRLKELLGFAKWVYAQEMLEVAIAQIDRILVGRWLDTSQLGAYAKAKDLSSTATNTLASLMQKVGFAAFAKIQDRMDKLREGFRKAVDMLMATSVPIALLLALEGGAAVNVLLGSAWFPIVVPLKIFAFGNLFSAFTGLVAPVFSALGRPELLFRMNVLRLALTVPLISLGFALGGVSGLAWAVVGIWIATLAYVVAKARPILQIPARDFLPALVDGGIACAAVFGADVVLRAADIGDGSVWAQSLKLAFLGVLYFVVLAASGFRRTTGPFATGMSILRELKIVRRGA